MADRLSSAFTYAGVFLFFSLLLFGCLGTKDLSVVNLSDLYRGAAHTYHPEFAVAHQTDSTSKLLVRLNTKELLFSRQSDDRFRAFITIRYQLVDSYESINEVLDSGYTAIQVEETDKNRQKIFEVNFHLPKKKTMLLVITIHDDQKNLEEDFYQSIENQSSQSRQSFAAFLMNEDQPLFRNYVSNQDSIRITYRNPEVRKLWVSVFTRSFPLAPPPFSFDVRNDFDYTPDDSFSYEVNDSNYIVLNQPGFYHFRADTTDKEGFTLYCFSGSFPSVTSPEQMVECVRYLTTKREFEQMKLSPDKKAAMDKFWLDLGANPERSKYLIRKYYTRIREANQYFTSFTEGWRTDRGMVYTVFGKPNNVYRNTSAESWIYGTPNNTLSINFFFTRVNNPFTDNDFLLSREPLFEGSWMRAVDVWRQGRVYNDN